jgi:hypothetical protein
MESIFVHLARIGGDSFVMWRDYIQLKAHFIFTFIYLFFLVKIHIPHNF